MNMADRVAASKSRGLIEELLISKHTCDDIIKIVALKTGEAFELEEIKEYQKEYLNKGRGLVSQVFDVARNMAKAELPVVDEVDQLSKHFSFQKINEDLELIYNRIRELKHAADMNLEDDTYDVRIVKYLAQAESIRTRVVKNQFDGLRKSILLTIGKKIVVAAVSVFMPYIPTAKRDEAKRRFLSAIEPLIDAEVLPPKPVDIEEIEEDLHGEQA